MSGIEYLEKILEKYKMPADKKSKICSLSDEFHSKIKHWANGYLVDFSFSGSFAKGTTVNGSTDVDFFISLTSTISNGLKEIYESLYEFLNNQNYKPKKQNVSIGISFDGCKIDFVPAKRIDQYSDNHSIFTNRTGNWIKTNIKNHISYVNKYDRKKETKLTKIWRNINGLEFPSFYIELSVINALYNKNSNTDDNFLTVLKYLSNDFINANIPDPSNTNNIVSDTLNKSEKQKISDAAKISCAKNYWSEIIW